MACAGLCSLQCTKTAQIEDLGGTFLAERGNRGNGADQPQQQEPAGSYELMNKGA